MPSALRSGTSTLATWGATILRALEAHGVEVEPLARRAGIDPGALGPDARVPREALNRLWALAVEATGDPAFGLEASRFTAQTTFHALGYAVLASATLKEAFERIIRYRRLIGDVLQLQLVDAGDRYRFLIDVSANPDVPFQAVDAIAAGCARQARLLHGTRPCNPLAVWFARPAPTDIEPYRRAFRAPLHFGAGRECARVLARRPRRSLAGGQRRAGAWQRRGAGALPRAPRAVARIDPRAAGAAGGVSRRRAVEAGDRAQPRHERPQPAAPSRRGRHVVQSAAERCARELARSYVEECRLSVTEIAFVLGFADTSTFSRAFKRWTGMSPLRWAASHRQRRDVDGTETAGGGQA